MRHTLGAKGCALLGVVLSLDLGGAAVARADDPAAPAGDPAARANALFAEGRRLLTAGEIPAACARFEESQRLLPRGGTLLNLGLCHEQEGKLGEASDELRAALEIARRDGRTDREPIAAEHLAAVELRLSQEKRPVVPEPPAPPPPPATRPPPPTPLPSPPPPTRPIPRWVWAGAVLTGALAATTAVAGVVSLDRRSEYLAMRTPALYDRATSMQHWATAAGIATAAAGGATLILYWRRPYVPADTTISLDVGPGRLLLCGRF